MMVKRYHLTCSQNFYGQVDAKTYYNVPGKKVWAGMRFMCEHFNAPVVFVYEAGRPVGKNVYVGSYSRKYDNFKTADGIYSVSHHF